MRKRLKCQKQTDTHTTMTIEGDNRCKLITIPHMDLSLGEVIGVHLHLQYFFSYIKTTRLTEVVNPGHL